MGTGTISNERQPDLNNVNHHHHHHHHEGFAVKECRCVSNEAKQRRLPGTCDDRFAAAVVKNTLIYLLCCLQSYFVSQCRLGASSCGDKDCRRLVSTKCGV